VTIEAIKILQKNKGECIVMVTEYFDVIRTKA